MSKQVSLVLAQINPIVGDLRGNADKIIAYAKYCHDELQADMLAFPELAIIGYPTEDLITQPEVVDACEEMLEKIKKEVPQDLCVIVGYPRRLKDVGAIGEVEKTGETEETGDTSAAEKNITNHLEVLLGGKSIASYAKRLLPSYQVFDEQRLFAPGDKAVVFSFKDISFGVTICEDLWQPQPAYETAKMGAEHIISINASPYSIDQHTKRKSIVSKLARNNNISISYVNCCGGQDEVVFDGSSFVCDRDGDLIHQAPMLAECGLKISITNEEVIPEGVDTSLSSPSSTSSPSISQDIAAQDRIKDEGNQQATNSTSTYLPDISEEVTSHTKEAKDLTSSASKEDKMREIYEVLKYGLSEYLNKNNFSKVVLGLSGGIDSALVACIARDVLPKDRVIALMMPHKWTAAMSLEDAAKLAKNLGIEYYNLPISTMVEETHKILGSAVSHKNLSDDKHIATQNIQPRVRAVLLMTMANMHNALLLSTSNRSESAVGYSTLYGDMAGTFAPIKHVYKTMVYQLAHYRNSIAKNGKLIPARIIERAPSAELYEGQEDADNLPDYETLDNILKAYIEDKESLQTIIDRGFERQQVIRIAAMVDANEYKRRQAAPGTRISNYSLSKDRRYPITNHFPQYRQSKHQLEQA